MPSREIITKAARQYGWDVTKDERAQMNFDFLDVKVIVLFTASAAVQVAEVWNEDDIDQITGGCPAVVDTLRMFGRQR